MKDSIRKVEPSSFKAMDTAASAPAKRGAFPVPVTFRVKIPPSPAVDDMMWNSPLVKGTGPMIFPSSSNFLSSFSASLRSSSVSA